MNKLEQALSGGHHNSLGNTEAVVTEVLEHPERFDELFNCYFSDDELVRLRTSSAMKRICLAKKELLIPYIARFLDEISEINQASTQWTLAILFDLLKEEFDAIQYNKALEIMKYNLANHDDWIVLNTTMQTLADWSKSDDTLKKWLLPHLQRLSKEDRKSVAGRAKKIQKNLESKI